MRGLDPAAFPAVIPAKAGIQLLRAFAKREELDSGFRRADEMKGSRVMWNARAEAN